MDDSPLFFFALSFIIFSDTEDSDPILEGKVIDWGVCLLDPSVAEAQLAMKVTQEKFKDGRTTLSKEKCAHVICLLDILSC